MKINFEDLFVFSILFGLCNFHNLKFLTNTLNSYSETWLPKVRHLSTKMFLKANEAGGFLSLERFFANEIISFQFESGKLPQGLKVTFAFILKQYSISAGKYFYSVYN